MRKNGKRNLLIALAVALAAALIVLGILVLTNRNAKAPEETAPATQTPTVAPTAAPTQAPTEEPTEEPTEAPTQAQESTEPVAADYANPLTGEAMAEPLTQRIFMVSINNHKEAMPQHGISQADIYYEMLVEGGITRCLGVFTDIGSVEKLGAVRSARIYTVSLAQCYDAVLCHAGGSAEADTAIAKLGIADIDGVRGSGGDAFYRDQARRSAGYALEHTLFTGSDLLLQNAEKRELRLEQSEPYDFGLTFAEDATPAGGERAGTLTFAFGGKNAKKTTMTYNAGTGKYEAAQFDEEWIDGNTGKVLSFENVLVLYANTYTQKDGTHKSIDLVGKGDGLFACNGQIIPIKWSRSADTAPFVYTLTDGTPLTFGVGHTYIALVPLNADVSYE